jgi:hypothetical protein
VAGEVVGDDGLVVSTEIDRLTHDRIAITAACRRPAAAHRTARGRRPRNRPAPRARRAESHPDREAPDGIRRETICEVLYVALRGAYAA